jgi:hypothetical protein
VAIDGDNKRARVTAVGGAEFEVNDGGIFPVQVSPTAGRRLLQQVQVRRPRRPACPLQRLGSRGRRVPLPAGA